jgi:glutathione S-transferase
MTTTSDNNAGPITQDPAAIAPKTPILYSFRRCPYAMRARMALVVSGQVCQLREVVLRDKPPSLLEYSRKGTVPVLVLPDETVIDESRDVMRWALNQSDPEGWLAPETGAMTKVEALVDRNDQDFKTHLDRYKYATRYEDADPLEHRTQAERFLAELESRLESNPYLFGRKVSFADVAIGPFIRQFANADKAWFDSTPYTHLRRWLDSFVSSERFLGSMKKYPQWHEGDAVKWFPG